MTQSSLEIAMTLLWFVFNDLENYRMFLAISIVDILVIDSTRAIAIILAILFTIRSCIVCMIEVQEEKSTTYCSLLSDAFSRSFVLSLPFYAEKPRSRPFQVLTHNLREGTRIHQLQKTRSYSSHSSHPSTMPTNMMSVLFILAQLLAVSYALSPEAAPSKKRAASVPRYTPGTTSPANSRLFFRDGSDVYNAVLPQSTKSQLSSTAVMHDYSMPSPLDLPRHSVPRNSYYPLSLNLASPKQALLDTEINVGRVAMAAAVVLFSVEIATGQSLPDQFVAFLS